MTNENFALSCRQTFLPPKKVLAEEWIPANVRTPPGSEYDGLLTYDVAPYTREVFRAWDNSFVREIYLMWATRNSKTTTSIALLIFACVNMPGPAAYGMCDEGLLTRTVDDQFYPMMLACDATKHLVPNEGKRPKTHIKFERCKVRKAFGGSTASVSGYPAKYTVGGEWSKWPRKKSKEAAPKNAYQQRRKGFPYTYKSLFESAPGKSGECDITALVYAATTDRRYWVVPCALCGMRQELIFEHLVWDAGKDEDKPDIVRAKETAHYRCPHCKGRIESDKRGAMIRAGEWLSAGQTIDKRNRIIGEPNTPSPYVGFGPLSSLNSLLISGWDQLVADWLACGDDPDKKRDYVNSTLAQAYDENPNSIEPNELGLQLATDDKAGICPMWSLFLTIAYDLQPKKAGWRFPWQACAWGLGGRGAVIAKGTATSWKEVEEIAYQRRWPHADGGDPLTAAWRVMDSGDGNSQEDVFEFCRQHPRFLPLKGSSTDFDGAYDLSDPDGNDRKEQKGKDIDKRKLLLAGKFFSLIVNSERSQNWLQRVIDGRVEKTQPNAFTIAKEFADDHGFLRELLNEIKVDGYDKQGFKVSHWKRRDRNFPNDQRDLVRYNWGAAMLVVHHGSDWWNLPTRVSTPVQVPSETRSRRQKEGNFVTQGGGRKWRK